MAVSDIKLKVDIRFAWWVNPYLEALKFYSRFFYVDLERQADLILRGARLIVDGKKTAIMVR